MMKRVMLGLLVGGVLGGCLPKHPHESWHFYCPRLDTTDEYEEEVIQDSETIPPPFQEPVYDGFGHTWTWWENGGAVKMTSNRVCMLTTVSP